MGRELLAKLQERHHVGQDFHKQGNSDPPQMRSKYLRTPEPNRSTYTEPKDKIIDAVRAAHQWCSDAELSRNDAVKNIPNKREPDDRNHYRTHPRFR